ncbi:hypothetical protein V1264_007615 [Littorina saxatilis]|uniref:Transmembrane protein n=1 Tax=Littorina saxatilis TaxID=31220 RepID=A0AAN9G4T9_9CAEN
MIFWQKDLVRRIPRLFLFGRWPFAVIFFTVLIFTFVCSAFSHCVETPAWFGSNAFSCARHLLGEAYSALTSFLRLVNNATPVGALRAARSKRLLAENKDWKMDRSREMKKITDCDMRSRNNTVCVQGRGGVRAQRDKEQV